MDIKQIYCDYCADVNSAYLETTFDIFDNKIFLDPDEVSSKLYDALYKLFFYDYRKMLETGIKCVQIIGQKYKGPLFYSFFIKDNPMSNEVEEILSVDYIGPSKFQSYDIAKLSVDKIKINIKESRTLGGHILWPRATNNKTINQARGGDSGCGLYDRTDWTFLLLKHYYSVIDIVDENDRLSTYLSDIKNEFIKQKISLDDINRFRNLFKAFDLSREWFKKFKSFGGFCDFFILKGSFITDSYEVVELTSYFPIKPDREGYLEYIDNNLKAIRIRNSKF